MLQLERDFYEQYALKWFSTERRQWERRSTWYKVSNLCSLMELEGSKPKRILDFGCGLGDALDLLAKHFQIKDGIGIDISSGMIEYAKKQYPEYAFAQGGIEKLKNRQVDIITFFDVLEHIKDIATTLEAAKSSADYIGIGIPLEKTWLISLLNSLQLKERKSRLYYSEGHLHEFNRSEVEAILKEAGLKILRWKTCFAPEDLQFSTYVKNRIKSKSGYLARIKYYCYVALGKLPYGMTRPLFQAVAGVNLYILCKCYQSSKTREYD